MAEGMPSDMSLGDFNLMNVKVLRDYRVHKRGLQTTGRKDELVSWPYGTYFSKAPILPSAMETLKMKAEQYRLLLFHDGKNGKQYRMRLYHFFAFIWLRNRFLKL